jgi:transposase-like protein
MLYPKNQIEFESSFRTDAQCLEYLYNLKFEDGFICNKCDNKEYWVNLRQVLVCKKCRQETSITSGTIFHRSKIPIHLLFRVLWFIVVQKTGVSALSVQKILGLKRYETVWTWLHKFRGIMILPNRERLSGTIEIDETFVGGIKKGKRGRGADGKEIVIIAIELVGKHTGRVRVEVIKNASRICINEFIKNNVELGSTIVTDGWKGYVDVERMKYKHKIETKTIVANEENLTPNVHRIASLLKRWLLGTHQNFTSSDYLKYYLDEYTFRYNRRKANSRGLLFYILLKQAIQRKPISNIKNREL